MRKHNTYEQYTSSIVNEDWRSSAEKIGRTALTVAGSIGGADTTSFAGFGTNAYSPDKRYYPNIRSSFLGWRNISMDKINSHILQAINTLKSSPRQDIIATQYSKNAPQVAANEMSTILNTLKDEYKKLPQDPGVTAALNLMGKNVVDISDEDFENTIEPNMSNYIGQMLNTSAQPLAVKESYNTYEQIIECVFSEDRHSERGPDGRFIPAPTPVAPLKTAADIAMANTTPAPPPTSPPQSQPAPGQSPQVISFTQKAMIGSLINTFSNLYERWKYSFNTIKLSEGKATADHVPGSEYITEEGGKIKVLPDKWVDFLSVAEGAIVGFSQRGRGANGINAYQILTGMVPGKYINRQKGVDFKSETAIDPAILKRAHIDIMTPLFLTKNERTGHPLLLYLTQGQWKSISEGGRIGRAVTNVAHQIGTTSKTRPRVQL